MADSNGKPAAENEDDVSHIFVFSIIFLFIEIIFNCALISFDPKTTYNQIAFFLIGLKLIYVGHFFVFTTAIQNQWNLIPGIII